MACANINILCAQRIPANEIWYTSTDGKVVEPGTSYSFGANIENNTYQDNKGILKFTATINAVGNYAYDTCDTLATIVLPDSVLTIGNSAFYTCTNLTDVTLGRSVQRIGTFAFRECGKLSKIFFPATLQTIETFAFYKCSALPSITLPASLDTLADYAFAACTGLTDVYVCAETPLAISTSAFYGVTLSGVTLHVPTGCMSAYQAANVWSTFGTIQEWNAANIKDVNLRSSEVPEFQNSDIYTLSGQRISTPRPGNIYLLNGKKVIY